MAAKFLKSLFGDDGIEEEEYYDDAPAAPAKGNNKVVSFNESRAKLLPSYWPGGQSLSTLPRWTLRRRPGWLIFSTAQSTPSMVK